MHHSRADGTPLPFADSPASAALAGIELPSLDQDVFWHKDGTAIPISLTSNAIVENGEIVGAVLVVSDISDRVRLEGEIRQAQKMDAIGQLAGGVAHDFNNLLTVISGYSEFALRRLGDADPLLSNEIQEIGKAADRATELTKQLLAFSRKQMLQPEVLDVNEIVVNTVSLLRRLIGEAISVVTTLDPKLPRTKADAGQIEQLLLNLSLNARDSMPVGGILAIETRGIVGADGAAFVRLSVRDTGHGMSEATRLRIFEPFFTTKEQGKGTGLGLSTVYAIVRQVHGTIEVQSAPEAGALGMVRAMVRMVLTSEGYAVVEAADPAEALAICAEGRSFDLLVTDIVMPGMTGHELARQLVSRQPSLKVLLTSGYSSDIDGIGAKLDLDTAFLQKPYELSELAAKVRTLLDAPVNRPPLLAVG